MTQPLTDDALRRLKRTGGPRAAADPSVIALCAEVVERYPQAKMHWLTDSRDAIFNDWYTTRLHGGRLAAMVDKAHSVAALRSLARSDLQQYAAGQRRKQLPARLFQRLNDLLRADAGRFTVMVAATAPGSTCWTLTTRPATAAFSERDAELKAHVWAVGLTPLEEDPDAAKQTQFIGADELARYAYEMLDRSARGLTLDQLVRGLVLTYGLDPTFEELPDERTLADTFYTAERAGVPIAGPPRLPAEDRTADAQRLIERLSERQLDVLKKLLEGYESYQEIATALGCSKTTVSNAIVTLRAVISDLATPEQQPEILAATATLLEEDANEF
jgi:DNA-binding CsgD family transcriptional regulator